MQNDGTDNIDESLYSRQLYVLGKEAMSRMKHINIFISGINGVGLEIAKCVILAGVNSVTLHDTKVATMDELSTNYYAHEKDIGKNRASVVFSQLSELNPYVKVSVDKTRLNEKHFSINDIVVICDRQITSLIHFNAIARRHKTKFIVANTFGSFGYIFCDFGNEFIVSDPDSEEIKSGTIVKAENKCFISNEHHNLCTGETIKITYQGVEHVEVVKSIKDIHTFSTSLSETFDKAIQLSNTHFVQIKTPMSIQFDDLETSLIYPEFATIIQEDFDLPQFLHAFNMALSAFSGAPITNKLPCHINEADIQTMLKLTKSFGKIYDNSRDNLIEKLVRTCGGNLCPLDSVIGSIAGQEVIKAASGKFTPIKQWFYFDVLNLVPNTLNIKKYDGYNCRSSGQIKVLGSDICRQLHEANIFVVGAGAIGCEHAKNLAMMSVGTLHITDMDKIEKSNLNRQFLFRPKDIGTFKSEAIRRAVRSMNPHTTVLSKTEKVAPETLNIFSDKFFSDVDIVVTALDNINARNFVDGLCVKTGMAMIDSGTLGAKGNTQSIIPFVTESYGSSSDPAEKSVPVCTLKIFPYQIEHTVQWARDLFEGLFIKAPEDICAYIKDTDSIKLKPPTEIEGIVDNILMVHKYYPTNVNDCIKFACDIWYENFRDKIHYLVEKYPEDTIADGVPFWSGTKKFPTYSKLDRHNQLHMDFIIAMANIWASVCNFNEKCTKQHVKDYLKRNKAPKILKPKGEININEGKPEAEVVHEVKIKSVNEVLSQLDGLNFDNIVVIPTEFEKDDDSNGHIDFVTSASNLRATNYGIPLADRLATKKIAGKIIPAIATTTSLVSGLVALEIIKRLRGDSTINDYSNAFINLGISLFAFSTPIEVKLTKIGNYVFSMWDKLTMTDSVLKDVVKNVIEMVGEDYEVCQINAGAITLYTEMGNSKQKQVKMNTLVKTLYMKYGEFNIDDVGDSIQLMVFVKKTDEDEDEEKSDENDGLDPIMVTVKF
jgi:ubiquitin-activating enzyme E1